MLKTNEKQVELPVQLVVLCCRCGDLLRFWKIATRRRRVNPFGCTRLTFGNNRCKANPRISTIFVVRKSYNSQKAQVTRVSCAFSYAYLVFLLSNIIFEFISCILTYFSKNRTWTDVFVLIPAWHLQFNTNLLRENKDKCSLFFYAVSRGDFLFTVRKIIIKPVNRKEF